MTLPGIGVIRLSRLTDETTSPVRQRQHIATASETHRIDIVDWVEDLDVSASKFSPFKRPSLGPWLTDPELIAKYKVLLYWRLDRFVRKGSDFRDILSWADKHGKVIQSATEPMLRYDPNSTGFEKAISEVIGQMAATFAEIESTNTSIRVTDTHRYLKSQGNWSGGPVPFGYVPVKSGNHFVLEPSDLTFPILREIVDRLVNNESLADIARDFNNRGLPNPANLTRQARGLPINRQGVWDGNSISSMFRTKALLGYRMSNKLPVLDSKTGLPMVDNEPLLTESEYATIVARRPVPRPKQESPNPLVGIAFCAECGSPLYYQKHKVGEKLHEYLKCKETAVKKELRKCTASMVPFHTALEYIEDSYLSNYGDLQSGSWVYQAAEDNTSELEQCKASIQQLVESASTLTNATVISVFTAQIQALEARVSELESVPRVESGYQWITGTETNEELWNRMGWHERGQLLRDEHVTMKISRIGNAYSVAVHMPQVSKNPE